MALTIRPSEEMNKHIEEIKKHHGFKSASKVIEMTVLGYIKLLKQVDRLDVKLYEKKNELFKIKDIIFQKQKSDQEYNNLIEKLSFNKEHDLKFDYSYKKHKAIFDS